MLVIYSLILTFLMPAMLTPVKRQAQPQNLTTAKYRFAQKNRNIKERIEF